MDTNLTLDLYLCGSKKVGGLCKKKISKTLSHMYSTENSTGKYINSITLSTTLTDNSSTLNMYYVDMHICV